MKFLKCDACDDMVALRPWEKTCKCGKTHGNLKEDGRQVLVNKGATVLIVPNDFFIKLPNDSIWIEEVE